MPALDADLEVGPWSEPLVQPREELQIEHAIHRLGAHSALLSHRT
jgi:hypothetical protein